MLEEELMSLGSSIFMDKKYFKDATLEVK